MYNKFYFLLLLMWCASSPAFAHSVNYSITKSESITLKAGFGGNDPMSYAAVKIFSPDNSEVEYQNGRTDKNGCFSFVPDKPGKWTITMMDGTGHGLKEVIAVNEEMLLSEAKSHGLTLIQKIFVTVCVIWGAFGTFIYFKKDKRKS